MGFFSDSISAPMTSLSWKRFYCHSGWSTSKCWVWEKLFWFGKKDCFFPLELLHTWKSQKRFLVFLTFKLDQSIFFIIMVVWKFSWLLIPFKSLCPIFLALADLIVVFGYTSKICFELPAFQYHENFQDKGSHSHQPA